MLVGTTGTGKTTTLNIYTGSKEKTGCDHLGVTTETRHVPEEKHSESPIWIDNPGWDDPEGRGDRETWKKLLRNLAHVDLDC